MRGLSHFVDTWSPGHASEAVGEMDLGLGQET
jgi:hypothetical protein